MYNVRALTQKIFGVIPLKALYISGNNSEQNRAYDSSKNVRFLCYEGFSIFSTNFKGNKNVILANISKSKNVIKNRGHGFLLLFNLTS